MEILTEVVRSTKDSARQVQHPKSRSRVSNGRDLLPGIDGRSPTARRYKDITLAILTDQGGADRCSESRKHLIRRFAAAAVLAERLEAKLVSGVEIDIQDHATLCSSLVRLGARIGIDRIPRDVSSLTLSDYLAGDSAEDEDATQVAAEDEDATGGAPTANTTPPVGRPASKPASTMALDSAPPKTNAELSDLDEDIQRVCKGEVL